MTTSGQDRGLRLAAPIGPAGEMRQLYAGSHALLVGVSQYQDRSAWPSLESIPRELQDLERTLKAQGFQTVGTVLNPTGAELRRAIEDVIERHGHESDNRLFFFFSGHGHTLENGTRGYFVPRDAPDPLRDEPGFRRAALSMQQIATWAEDMGAKHVLFAFDSCFSGSIFRTRDRAVTEPISAATAQKVRQFLSAGGAEQRVPARSVFTPILIRGLEGAADIDGDGFVTGSELGIYVSGEVIAYKSGQTPQFGKIRDVNLDRGDIVFQPSLQNRTSFFITSAGLTNGGNLAGLAGADKHCQTLAQAAGAGHRTWRAYLSSQAVGGQRAINARDRIGAGPWYNARGVLIARNVDELHSAAAKLSKEHSLTEKGDIVKGLGDNPSRHDILTGSDPSGRAMPSGADLTCANWTSSTTGSSVVGHHDRQGGGPNPTSWNSAHRTTGCSLPAMQKNGGDGLFYCFAAK